MDARIPDNEFRKGHEQNGKGTEKAEHVSMADSLLWVGLDLPKVGRVEQIQLNKWPEIGLVANQA